MTDLLDAIVQSKLEDLGERLSAVSEDPIETARRAAVLDEAWARHERELVAEYRAHGLCAPEIKPGGVLVSLPMMLKCGWWIEDVGGRRALVGPGGR